MALPLPVSMRWDLPRWAQHLARSHRRFSTMSERMELAVELSRRNVAERTGDPFGAAVFDLSTRRLMAVGVNVVAPSATVAAHAEVVAVCLAGVAGGHHDLRAASEGPVELLTSCAPCMMCQGAILGSGVSSLVIAAREEDTRSLGLGGSSRPPDWVQELQRQGVAVTEDVLRTEAVAVLREYADGGGGT
ncbi:MAG: deaminase [bacterium]|nr:nucleoside deaminase [Acidimicrobiia bacterium]MCY4649898.1 deaminase [bacterium]